eukprot:EC691431.1.p1 GENE.EC691431.1~~EC691431.1.p1  ORF type:complete len:129 (+),score=18.90 EC691431.1:31-387(+)
MGKSIILACAVVACLTAAVLSQSNNHFFCYINYSGSMDNGREFNCGDVVLSANDQIQGQGCGDSIDGTFSVALLINGTSVGTPRQIVLGLQAVQWRRLPDSQHRMPEDRDRHIRKRNV